MKIILFLILCVTLPCATIIAQVEFEKNVIMKENQLLSPKVVFLADIDNDGYLDMVSGSGYEERLSWYKNMDGEGTYGEMNVIDSEIGDVESIYVADINNDGYLDVIFTSLNDGKIGWYENLDGQGNFGPMQIITSLPSGYSSLIAVDIDGDGDLDIVASCIFSSEIVWYENLNGLGDFSLAKVIDTGVTRVSSVFAADIDGDGFIDIVATVNRTDSVVWYKNMDGLGNFSSQKVISRDIYRSEGISVIDLDGDGDMDVVVAYDNSTISWFENMEGNGNLWEQHQIVENQNGVSNILAVDIDNDGDLDIVGIGSELVWYEHETDNNEIIFENAHIITTHVSQGNAIAAGDINNDGNIDIAIASLTNNFIAWYKNDSNGNFYSENFISLFIRHPYDIVAVDIDGDSDLDIVFTDWIDKKIIWLENVQGGEKFIPHIIATNIPNVAKMAFGDIDNDGFVDIASSSLNESHIAWYKNDGQGNFEKHLLSTAGYGSRVIEIADMDGDGFPDIITSIGHQLVWYKNLDGQGNFSEPNLIANLINSNGLSISDINSDGFNDIVSVSSIEGKDLYFENKNNASYFIEHDISPQYKFSSSVLTMDVDDDGKMDVISAVKMVGVDPARIIWYENLGDETFSQERVITTSETTLTTLVAGDMDLDGKDDLIYISPDDKKIAWQKRQTGSFGSQQTIEITQGFPRALYVGDMDQNGSLDIVVGFSYPGKIVWYKNLSTLSVSSTPEPNEWMVFPNPTSDFLKIHAPNEILKISLYDFSGRQILTKYDSSTIDLSQQSPGFYLLKTYDQQGNSQVMKVIRK